MKKIIKFLFPPTKSWLDTIMFVLLGPLSLSLVGVFIYSEQLKNNTVWPPLDQLSVAAGYVNPENILESYGNVDFNFSGSNQVFRYQSLYGRKLGAVENALQIPGALILVRYDSNKKGSSGFRDYEFFTVYEFIQGEEVIVSYEQAQKTFNDDSSLFPWLTVIFFFVGLFLTAYGFLEIRRRIFNA